MPQIAHPQIITLIPNQVPNGIESGSGDQFHQRFNIQLGVAAVSQSRAFTITLPSEFTFVANSVTATSNLATLSAFFSGSPATDQLAFGLTGTASNQILTVEFDITTPTSFAGIAQGGAADTVYAFNFALGTNQSAAAVPVSKHQNKLIRLVSFTSPDSVSGDTTIGGGRLFKLEFPNALPDLSHTGLSGLSASQGITDSKTDVLYSFIASEDSTLVRYVAGDPLGFFSAQDVPPIRSSRQIPRIVPRTFIREDYTFTFADSLEGLAAVGELATERTFYIYVLADPATGRFPTRLQNGGNAKKGFDNTSLGAFSGRAFLGRSGPLLISHPPEFIAVGWDYDDDGGDDFNTTGVIQIPSDISGMASVDENRKDNRDIVVDSGSFFNKGSALPTLNNGRLPDPISSFDFLFFVEDTDNSQNFQMGIFLSTTGGLTEADLGGGISTLGDAILIPGSDTLTVNNQVFSFSPILRDQTTGLATSVFPEGEYFAYFVATDGDAAHRVVVPVLNDPFISNPTPAKITIKHSPLLMVDAFSINDFDGDGDLDVITGIDVSQMMTDLDGKDLLSGPAQRYVNIFWGGTLGREGDLDEDDSATIDLYFSTRSDFRDSRKSVAYTSGNSNGQDLLATVGVEDTHLIEAGIEEDGDELFDNNFAWDLWTYVSPEQTIPMTGVRYYLYALLKEAKPGGTERLVSFTDVGALQFQHPPYIRPIDPAQDLTVSMNEPVLISWEAVDVDNAETGGKSANPVGRGRIASNSRSDSPNIRILLTSADFGEVTTWGTLTNALNVHRSWLGNSGDGGLTEEIELNEGVDTTFVIIGHRIRNNLNRGGSSGDLALQTNLGVGETYFVYLAIDGGRDQTVGDLGGTAGDFSAFSPAVRAPGTITFTGTVPTNPPSVPRFFVPKEITVVENEVLHYPIIPDTLLGKTVGTVNIFLTADPNLFEAIDKDLTKDGIQPFTLEDITRTGVDPIHVDQRAYLQNGKLRLDFIFHDPITGLTKFNGQHVLATAHLRAKPLTDSSFVRTTLSLDNTGNRVTQILDKNVENLDALVPPPTRIDIIRRSQVSGAVPLEGRTSSADTVTFFLREVGDLDAIEDSLFSLNDIDTTAPGVQILSTGVNGNYTLNRIPTGRWILTASVARHLTGHDTLQIHPGQDLNNIRPVLDGNGVDRSKLLTGDAAGYTGSDGKSLPDNFIDSADINAINVALFAQAGDADYNPFADVNRDDIINAIDKNFAAVNQTSNSGQTGRIRPVFPTFKQIVPEGKNTDAIVTLSGLPTSPLQAGDSLDVAIEVQGAVAVRTYEVHLTYDPALLQVEDLISTGSLFQNYLVDMAVKDREGTVSLANSIIGRTPIGGSGNGTLAVLRFRVIGKADQTQMALNDVTLIDVSNTNAKPKLTDPITLLLTNTAPVYHDREGNEIQGLILADEDATVDFNDFLVLSKAFGARAGRKGFDRRADLNVDGRVDFADFLLFSNDFGKVAVDAPASS